MCPLDILDWFLISHHFLFVIPEKGLALGNALSDPYNMLEYGDFAYQTGLVDRHGYHSMKLFENLAKEYWPEIESKIVC